MKFSNKHILVGHYDWYGSFHYDTIISCYESSRPIWQIEYEDENAGLKNEKGMSCVPTSEHFIEDALILLAYEIEKDQSFIKLLNKLLDCKNISNINLYEDLIEDKRKLILMKLKEIPFKYDLIFMNIPMNQIKILDKYQLKAKYLVDVNLKMKN